MSSSRFFFILSLICEELMTVLLLVKKANSIATEQLTAHFKTASLVEESNSRKYTNNLNTVHTHSRIYIQIHTLCRLQSCFDVEMFRPCLGEYWAAGEKIIFSWWFMNKYKKVIEKSNFKQNTVSQLIHYDFVKPVGFIVKTMMNYWLFTWHQL